MTRDTALVGGPHDGQIVFATDQYPIIMFAEPRPPNLFEEDSMKQMPKAAWDEKHKWYAPVAG